MADEIRTPELPADFQSGPICNVDPASQTVRLAYVQNRVESGAVRFPAQAAGEIAFVALRAAQTLPPSDDTPGPTRLLPPNSAAVARASRPGAVALMFRFGDATVGIELTAEAAQQIAQGLITASGRSQ